MINRKILLILLLILSLCFPTICLADSALPSAWAVDDIKILSHYKLLQGIEYGQSYIPFERNINQLYSSNITRSQFAFLVVNMYEKATNSKAAYTSTNFEDIYYLEGHNRIYLPYRDYIEKAYGLGIISGVSKTEFKPEDNITREQLCTMLVRLIKAIEKDINVQAEFSGKFADAEKISDWAKNDVNYAYESGIIKGIGQNKIDPKGYVTREQAFAMVSRLGIQKGYLELLSSEILAITKIRDNMIDVEKYNKLLSDIDPKSRVFLDKFVKEVEVDEIHITNRTVGRFDYNEIRFDRLYSYGQLILKITFPVDSQEKEISFSFNYVGEQSTDKSENKKIIKEEINNDIANLYKMLEVLEYQKDSEDWIQNNIDKAFNAIGDFKDFNLESIKKDQYNRSITISNVTESGLDFLPFPWFKIKVYSK